MIALERPGASGDQGVYADRIELQGIRARFPVPDFCRRATSTRRKWGHARSAPACCARSTGTTRWTTRSTCRARHRLGLERQLEPQAGQDTAVRLAFIGRRRHPELHERLAGRHRHRDTTSATRSGRWSASRSQSPAVSLFVDHTWNKKFTQRDRLLAAGQRQHRRAGRRARSESASTRSPTSSTRRCRT